MAPALTEKAYEIIVSDDEGRVCRDIPDELCDDQPPNFLRHVVSLTATKTGDGLADPKLVLAWLPASRRRPCPRCAWNARSGAAYTALSNTAIGILLLAAIAFGALAQLAGVWAVLGAFALMCGTAAAWALRLEEVQVR